MTLNDTQKIINNIAKLRWACRRGMLELDVLLGNFLEDVYPGLSEADKILFIRLLEQPDPQLFAWLLGSEVPKDADTKYITEKIRHHARSRF